MATSLSRRLGAAKTGYNSTYLTDRPGKFILQIEAFTSGTNRSNSENLRFNFRVISSDNPWHLKVGDEAVLIENLSKDNALKNIKTYVQGMTGTDSSVLTAIEGDQSTEDIEHNKKVEAAWDELLGVGRPDGESVLVGRFVVADVRRTIKESDTGQYEWDLASFSPFSDDNVILDENSVFQALADGFALEPNLEYKGMGPRKKSLRGDAPAQTAEGAGEKV